VASEDMAQKGPHASPAAGLSQLLRGSLVTQLIHVAATLAEWWPEELPRTRRVAESRSGGLIFRIRGEAVQSGASITAVNEEINRLHAVAK
jgi:hypothetical protein